MNLCQPFNYQREVLKCSLIPHLCLFLITPIISFHFCFFHRELMLYNHLCNHSGLRANSSYCVSECVCTHTKQK